MLNQLRQKLKGKKGFTLAELLIVIAIMAVLIGIAVPIFNAQLQNAKKQVEAANARAAKSLAVATYLQDEGTKETYHVYVDSNHDMQIYDLANTAKPTATPDFTVTFTNGVPTVTAKSKTP